MKKVVTVFAAAVMALGLVLPVLAADAPPAEKPPVLKVGDEINDFTVKNGLSGQDVSFLKDIKGKAKLNALVFFNTGCSSCIAEMEEISKVATEVGPEKLKVWGIAVDKRGEQAVKAYDEMYKYNVTYLLDPSFSLPPQFGFTYTPASVICKDGKVAAIKGGYDPNADKGKVAAEIKGLLK